MKDKHPKLSRLKTFVFYVGLFFVVYSFIHFLIEAFEVNYLVSGGTFRRLAPEYADKWLEVDTVLNLLDTKLMLSFIALILWVYMWRK